MIGDRWNHKSFILRDLRKIFGELALLKPRPNPVPTASLSSPNRYLSSSRASPVHVPTRTGPRPVACKRLWLLTFQRTSQSASLGGWASDCKVNVRWGG